MALTRHSKFISLIILAQGNQIASLYDLLTFKDKPLSESVVPEKPATRSAPPSYGPSQGRAAARRFPTS